MIKVITYGTYDLLHQGHIRLLERAKALGDYLIVGVTSDDYDQRRGKINVQQSLMERIEAIRNTGLADKIIVEEHEGQKIDDINRYHIDVFAVGSDWKGKFDYLKDLCEVVYLERTEGISSSSIRAERNKVRLGIVGDSPIAFKYIKESKYVNGIEVVALCTSKKKLCEDDCYITSDYVGLLEVVDAVYIVSEPQQHYQHIRIALEHNRHVLCESPMAMTRTQCEELFVLAQYNDCILMDAIKTAYATAYARLLQMAKAGWVGRIYSVDATCTSLRSIKEDPWNSICGWGPTALLPVFNLLGVRYRSKSIVSHIDKNNRDRFTKVDFIYDHAVASIKVANGVKSEGELVISGTDGFIYVPSPWWKTDYYEIRYEDSNLNKRYFYQLDGEGIRYELVAFINAIINGKHYSYVDQGVSGAICNVIEDFEQRKDFVQI